MTGKCYYCGAIIDGKVYRSSVCPECGRDLKTCVNCTFYSPGSHWDCRETISDPVREKEQANFCDFFRLSAGSRKDDRTRSDGGGVEDPDHRKAFDKLFGD